MIGIVTKLRNLLSDKEESTSQFEPLVSLESLETLLDLSESEPLLIYKHSVTCGISIMAKNRLAKLSDPGDPSIYEIVVQTARPISNAVAERFNITHQSPQVLLIRNREVLYHASHGAIEVDSIRKALSSS